MLTEKARAECVESAHLELFGARFADELRETLSHLVRRLIRECNSTDSPWWDLVYQDKVCDAGRQNLSSHKSLSTSQTCRNEDDSLGIAANGILVMHDSRYCRVMRRDLPSSCHYRGRLESAVVQLVYVRQLRTTTYGQR